MSDDRLSHGDLVSRECVAPGEGGLKPVRQFGYVLADLGHQVTVAWFDDTVSAVQRERIQRETVVLKPGAPFQ